MLYVSRKVGRDRWGITDTDDGVETVVSWTKLNELVELGIDVKGINLSSMFRRGKDGRHIQTISSVDVWQDPSKVSLKQVKAKVLSGVDISTTGRMITNITWDASKVPKNCRVRLSDFGSECGDRILSWLSSGSSITFVIDDRIKIRKNTFGGGDSSRYKLDIKEVNNQRTVEYVYDAVWADVDLVIDRPDRGDDYRALCAVRSGYNPGGRKYYGVSRDFVDSRLYKEFEAIANGQFYYKSSSAARTRARDFLTAIRLDRNFWHRDSPQVDEVYDRDNLKVFELLEAVTTCNPLTLRRFLGYMRFCDPSERVEELYVKLCMRAYRWFFDLVDELHVRSSRR